MAFPISLSLFLYVLLVMLGISSAVNNEFTWEKPIPLSIEAKASLVFVSYAFCPRVPVLCCSLVDTLLICRQMLHFTERRLATPNFCSDITFPSESGPVKGQNIITINETINEIIHVHVCTQ